MSVARAVFACKRYVAAASMTASSRVLAFVKLGRPKFLGGGFVMYGLGAALAAYQGATVDWPRYAWGQLVVTATQLMTHYANDYFDLAADRANATPTRWSGGSRVLVDGTLPPVVALVAAVVLAAVALAAGAHLAMGPYPPLVGPGVMLMLALSWEYSAPPLRLCARGLGELTTAFVVTFLVPWLGFVLQMGTTRRLMPLAVIAPAAFQFVMLLAIEFPDAAGDVASGKRTLVVRLGGAWSARLYVLVVSAAYLTLPLWVSYGLSPRLAIATACTSPLAAWQVTRVAGGAWRERERWNSIAFGSVALLVVTAAVEIIAALVKVVR
jgi:1,4-dihydroxy-2-naphthoate polyprenyltransferase